MLRGTDINTINVICYAVYSLEANSSSFKQSHGNSPERHAGTPSTSPPQPKHTHIHHGILRLAHCHGSGGMAGVGRARGKESMTLWCPYVALVLCCCIVYCTLYTSRTLGVSESGATF